MKRGRPKAAEMTVIGLPSKKKTKLANKTQNVVTTFSKLRPIEKDRLILECLVKPSAVFNAISEIKSIEGLYVLIMPRTPFRVNPNSIVA